MKKKTKIAYFVPGLYPRSYGGMEIFNYYLIENISKKFDIKIITDSNTNSLPNCIKFKSNLFLIKRFGLGKFSTFISLFFIFLRQRPEIVHIAYTSNFGFFAFWFTLLKKIFSFKLVVVNHGGGLKPWKNKWAQLFFFRNVEKLIAVSPEIKEEYGKRTGRNDIEIIFPLVPFPEVLLSKTSIIEKWNIERESTVILMVGSLKPLKAPDVVLEAFLSLGKEFIKEEKLVLVFAGDGEMKNVFEQRIISENLGTCVKLLGNVPFDQIGEMYKMAEIYVIASWFEGLPKSLVGAMAYKTPVIGSNVNGVRDIVKHNSTGLLFEKNNTVELTSHFKFSIENHQQLSILSENMYNLYRDNYSFENTITLFNTTYHSLLNTYCILE